MHVVYLCSKLPWRYSIGDIDLPSFSTDQGRDCWSTEGHTLSLLCLAWPWRAGRQDLPHPVHPACAQVP